MKRNYHIAPVKSLINDIQPDCGYVLVCSDDQMESLIVYDNVAVLQFADTEDSNHVHSISPTDVGTIITFLEKLECEDLFIACDAGESRSPAIVAGLLKISGRDDSYIWQSKEYRPNTLVYRTILEYAVSKKNNSNAEEELKRIIPCTPDEYRSMRKQEHAEQNED